MKFPLASTVQIAGYVAKNQRSGKRYPLVLMLEPERVRAELDVLVQLHEAGDDLFDPLEDERLAAADRDDRGRALFARVDALLDR